MFITGKRLAVLSFCTAAFLWSCFDTGTGTDSEDVSIQGTIKDVDGAPVSGVVVTATVTGGSSVTATTGSGGTYSCTVPSGSKVSITPSKQGVLFSPTSVRSAAAVPSQANFTMVPTGPCVTADATDMFTFQVKTPNGGEAFRVGDTMTMRFCNDDTLACRFSNTLPELSFDGGATWNRVGETGTLRYTFQWAITDSIETTEGTKVSTVSKRCRVRLMCYDDAPNIDISNADFTIEK